MLTPELEATLHRLVDVFLAENAVMNLSAFRTPEQCWIGNVLDSVAALDVACVRDARSLLDIGTGGGFPLLPLAIAQPKTECTGVDSILKKIQAIERIAAAMDLTNVRCVPGRAESLGHAPHLREQFDVVTARAVAEVNVLLEYASGFVRTGGHIVLWKSMTVDRELQDAGLAQAVLHCQLMERHAYDLPETWGKRQLLVFQKTSPLPDKYPREVGVPGKKPLV